MKKLTLLSTLLLSVCGCGKIENSQEKIADLISAEYKVRIEPLDTYGQTEYIIYYYKSDGNLQCVLGLNNGKIGCLATNKENAIRIGGNLKTRKQAEDYNTEINRQYKLIAAPKNEVMYLNQSK